MANKRVEGGLDTLARIERAWQAVVERGESPLVSEFVKKAGISYSHFCSEYREWAEKVRQRRDTTRPKHRTRSRATLPNSRTERVDTLEQSNKKLQAEVQRMAKAVERLEKIAERIPTLESENAKLRQVFLKLRHQLVLAGIPKPTIQKLWDLCNKR